MAISFKRGVVNVSYILESLPHQGYIKGPYGIIKGYNPYRWIVVELESGLYVEDGFTRLREAKRFVNDRLKTNHQ